MYSFFQLDCYFIDKKLKIKKRKLKIQYDLYD